MIDLFQQEINFLTAVRSSVLTVADSNENETSVSVSGDFRIIILYIDKCLYPTLSIRQLFLFLFRYKCMYIYVYVHTYL